MKKMDWINIFEIQKCDDVVVLTEKQGEKLEDSEDYYIIEHDESDTDGIVELEYGESQRFIVSDDLAHNWAKEYCLEQYTTEEIVKRAYRAWNPYFNDGLVFYDFEDGDIVSIALMPNETVSEDWDATPIYKIGANDMQYICTEENLFNELDSEFFEEYAENHSKNIEEFLNSYFLINKYKEIDAMFSYRTFDDAIIEFLGYWIEEEGL